MPSDHKDKKHDKADSDGDKKHDKSGSGSDDEGEHKTQLEKQTEMKKFAKKAGGNEPRLMRGQQKSHRKSEEDKDKSDKSDSD